MKGIAFYYTEFQRQFDISDASMGAAFKAFSLNHSPWEVFLWLEKFRTEGKLPTTMEPLLTNFFWEIY